MGASNVDIYIGDIRLPVVEPTFKIEALHDNQEQQVVGFGGVNLLGHKALTIFEYTSFYPANYDSSYCQFSNLLKPSIFVDKILKIKNGTNKTRLVIPKYNINGIYTIEGFSFSPEVGVDDIAYSIKMKEYLLPTIKTAEYNFEVYNFQYTKEIKSIEPQTYTIKDGENLQFIAGKFNTNVDMLLADNPQITNAEQAIAGTQLYIRGSQINDLYNDDLDYANNY